MHPRESSRLEVGEVIPRVSRAGFLSLLACGAATTIARAQNVPWWASATNRQLWLRRDGVDYVGSFLDWQEGGPGYTRLCEGMRDFETMRHKARCASGTEHDNVCTAVSHENFEVRIAPKLFQLLWEVQQVLFARGVREPLTVLSGYRSEWFNGTLRSEGSAADSMHLHGAACDYYVEGYPLSELRALVRLAPGIGGIGYYPNRGFIHSDVRDLPPGQSGPVEW